MNEIDSNELMTTLKYFKHVNVNEIPVILQIIRLLYKVNKFQTNSDSVQKTKSLFPCSEEL